MGRSVFTQCFLDEPFAQGMSEEEGNVKEIHSKDGVYPYDSSGLAIH